VPPDGKQPDLLISWNSGVHDVLWRGLQAQVRSRAKGRITIPDGALLAIECESDDAADNSRIFQAGVDWVVFAATPADFQRVLPGRFGRKRIRGGRVHTSRTSRKD